jgi:hypothetical protein
VQTMKMMMATAVDQVHRTHADGFARQVFCSLASKLEPE